VGDNHRRLVSPATFDDHEDDTMCEHVAEG
jgi:hypothetical protein